MQSKISSNAATNSGYVKNPAHVSFARWRMRDRGPLGTHTLEGTLCGSRASSLDLCSLVTSKPSGTAGLSLLVIPEGMLQRVRRHE